MPARPRDPCLVHAVTAGRFVGLPDRTNLSSLLIPARRWRNCPKWKLPFSNKQLLALCGKGLDIPARWNAAEFIRQGRLLILAMERISQLTRRRAIPVIARKSMEILRGQLEEVIRRATRKNPGARSSAAQAVTVDLLVPQHESIWMEAIREVFDDLGEDIEIIQELVPPVQSVMAQGYSKTGFLLAQEADPEHHPALAREAREIARKITKINDTTRKQFENTIRDSIKQGQTVPELATRLRDEVLPMSHSRSLTIARTESNNAYSIGAAQAFKESETLETVSVIGCEAREEESQFQYKGESTCNYEDLLVSELDDFLAVGWHPNHGGTLIPSGFREDTNRTGLATPIPRELLE